MNEAKAASIVTDPIVGRAVSAIVPNSDKQLDTAILERTFVDLGLLAQLDGNNSQVVFGRRGTGKSHLLKLLGVHRVRNATETSVFVDVRNLGSAQMMTDPTKSLTTRAVTVFRDLLGELQSRLLDLATDPNQPSRIEAIESVSALAESIAAVSRNVNTLNVSAEIDTSAKKSAGVSAELSQSPSIDIDFSSEKQRTTKFAESYTETIVETVDFSYISAAIDRAVTRLGITMFVFIIDEWSSIPQDIQPYIAEFLRRTIFPISRINVKFASLVYRSNFSMLLPGTGRIGLEFGGEITRNIDLDEHYAFERAPSLAASTFSNLLWHHLAGNISPQGHLEAKYEIYGPQELREALFNDDSAFNHLMMAGGGVTRDFLSIFCAAYFRSAVARTASVDVDAVREAAIATFQTEKLLNLDYAQRAALHRIGRLLYDASTGDFFLVRDANVSHPMIQSLFDMRVIHPAQRYYSDVTQPSGPSALFVLDYGASSAMGVASRRRGIEAPHRSAAGGKPLSTPPELSLTLLEGDG